MRCFSGIMEKTTSILQIEQNNSRILARAADWGFSKISGLPRNDSSKWSEQGWNRTARQHCSNQIGQMVDKASVKHKFDTNGFRLGWMEKEHLCQSPLAWNWKLRNLAYCAGRKPFVQGREEPSQSTYDAGWETWAQIRWARSAATTASTSCG